MSKNISSEETKTSFTYENKKIEEVSDILTLDEKDEVLVIIKGRQYRIDKCYYFKDKLLMKRYEYLLAKNEPFLTTE